MLKVVRWLDILGETGQGARERAMVGRGAPGAGLCREQMPAEAGGAGVSKRRAQRKKGPGSGRSRAFLSAVEGEVMH